VALANEEKYWKGISTAVTGAVANKANTAIAESVPTLVINGAIILHVTTVTAETLVTLVTKVAMVTSANNLVMSVRRFSCKFSVALSSSNGKR
jgi:hypothetical protein